MSNFEELLERYRPTLITAMRQAFAASGDTYLTEPQKVAAYVDIHIKLILTKISLADPMIGQMNASALANNVSLERIKGYLAILFAAIRHNLDTDSALNAAQKTQMARMVDQSERFLSIIVTPTVTKAHSSDPV